MAMVINGVSRGGAKQMAEYILAPGDNELTRVREIKGTLATDVRGSIAEMEAIAKGSRCEEFLYHAQICPEKTDTLTPEQFMHSVDLLEKNLKLEGHQRIVFEHILDGRRHYHVVWNRVDGETLKAVNMGNNYLVHERTAQELENEFGLEKLERRPNLTKDRGERAPEKWEFQQAERTGIDPRQLKAEVKALREQSKDGKEFAEALAEKGFTLARGDRRDFILIDPSGGLHSLGRLSGMKAADLREFMSEIDRAKLPTVEQAKQAEREGVTYHHSREVPHGKTAAKIFEAFQEFETGAEIAAKLPGQDIFIVRVTAGDARDFQAARESAKEAGNKRFIPTVKEGELVAVDKKGNLYKLNERTTGCSRNAIQTKTADLEQSPLMSVKEAREVHRFVNFAQADEKKAEREAAKEAERQAKIQADPFYNTRQYERLGAKERTAKHGIPQRDTGKPAYKSVAQVAVRGVANFADHAVKTLEGVLDILCGPAEPHHISPDERRQDVQSRREFHAQEAAEARREALQKIIEDDRSGRALDLAAIANLNREDAQIIKAYGDDGIRMLIEQEEKRERERQRERMRER
jgi:hypothetical protein